VEHRAARVALRLRDRGIGPRLGVVYVPEHVLFTFTVRRTVVLADEARVGPLWSKLTGMTSVGLWAGVGSGGRWIGFSG